MYTSFIITISDDNTEVLMRRFRPDGTEGDTNRYSLNFAKICADIWSQNTSHMEAKFLPDFITAIQLLEEHNEQLQGQQNGGSTDHE